MNNAFKMNSNDINERLFDAVNSGDYDKTLSCLTAGAKATYISTTCGRTAIGAAAQMGYTELLELLIKSCEEPDLPIFQKKPPVPIPKEKEIESTPDGMDSLEWEDEFNVDCDKNIEMVEPAANSNTHTNQESTSLYYYYAKTFERTGEILMDEMMDDDDNDSAISACNNNGTKTYKLRTQDPHTIDKILMSPLHYAAEGGHVDCVRILLEHNAKVHTFNTLGYSPLHVGVKYVEVIRLMLKHGTNANFKAINTGETPLHCAIRNRCYETIHMLIENNANVNESDYMEQTPLICSVERDMTDVAMKLIGNGARINIQDQCGNTALYHAVLQNNLVLATYLLENGARRVPANNLMHECARLNLLEMAKKLLEHGESYNVRDKDGLTPIHWAIIGRKFEMLELLLSVAREQILANTYVDRHENELLLAVHYIDTVGPFSVIARLLYAYGITNYKTYVDPQPKCAPCYIPFCQSPLSRAIMLNKLDLAEFLIKEGVCVSEICREHVVNNLRLMLAPNTMQFAKFLVYAGFNFPHKPTPVESASKWSPERQRFEVEMRQLCSSPLSLQAQARIAIRKRLIGKCSYMQSHLQLQKPEFQPTKHASSLSLMIQTLDIPTTLKRYLIEFNDCTTSVVKDITILTAVLQDISKTEAIEETEAKVNRFLPQCFR